METICPACGGTMETSTNEFPFNQYRAVKGIEHQVCAECGEMAFTADQLDMLFDHLQALKQKAREAECACCRGADKGMPTGC